MGSKSSAFHVLVDVITRRQRGFDLQRGYLFTANVLSPEFQSGTTLEKSVTTDVGIKGTFISACKLLSLRNMNYTKL